MRRAPSNETPRDRFRGLATSRTSQVIERLEIPGRRANRQAYEYTEEDIDTISSAIERKGRDTKARFRFPERDEFAL